MQKSETYVGIDLARRSNHKAVIISREQLQQCGPQRAFSFSHDLDGLDALRRRILKQTGAPGLDGVTVNIEPTSGVWEVVAAYMISCGAKVCFTRTDVVSQLRKVHSKFAKTDRIDARTLAGIPVSFPERLIPVVEVEQRIRTLRQLSTQRQRLAEDITRWKNRFIAKVEVAWTPLLVHLSDEQRFCAVMRAFFVKFYDPQKFVRCGRERFAKWWRKNAHGNTSPQLFEAVCQGAAKTAPLWRELQSSGAMPIQWETVQRLLKQDLRMISNFEKELQLIDKDIKEARLQVPECDLLEQLPGVGKVISVSLASILMPIERFANTKKCGAYTGFTSRQKSSAGHEISGLKITKTGNRRLKRNLALAADTAMKNDPELAAFAIRLLKAGKHYNKVRVAVGRKIAIRAYSLLKRFQSAGANATYIWRDPQGNTITKQQAKAITATLWSTHKAAQEQKGTLPAPAIPWPSENATKRRPSKAPRQNYAHV